MREKDFRFTLEEAAGALGDYGTLLPIILGVAAVTDMDLPVMFLLFGCAYIATGLIYRLPMAVEPMKAMGVIAITQRLTPDQIAGAGLAMSVILLLIGLTGVLKWIKKAVPSSIVRGIQLGISRPVPAAPGPAIRRGGGSVPGRESGKHRHCGTVFPVGVDVP